MCKEDGLACRLQLLIRKPVVSRRFHARNVGIYHEGVVTEYVCLLSYITRVTALMSY